MIIRLCLCYHNEDTLVPLTKIGKGQSYIRCSNEHANIRSLTEQSCVSSHSVLTSNYVLVA